MQRQFVVLSFKVKFGRLAFQKKKNQTKQTVNGSWVPQFFSAQIEILQKNWEHKLYKEGPLGNALQYQYDDWCLWNLSLVH